MIAVGATLNDTIGASVIVAVPLWVPSTALVASSIGSSRAADIEQRPYGPYGVQPPPPPYMIEPPAGPYAVQPPDEIPPTEPMPYLYAGRSYCWFPAGWRGPGWYPVA